MSAQQLFDGLLMFAQGLGVGASIFALWFVFAHWQERRAYKLAEECRDAADRATARGDHNLAGALHRAAAIAEKER